MFNSHDLNCDNDKLTSITVERVRRPVTMGHMRVVIEMTLNMFEVPVLVYMSLEFDNVGVFDNRTADPEDLERGRFSGSHDLYKC